MTQSTSLTVCFTGHRTLPKAALPHLPRLLDRALTDLILHEGATVFRAGGALGFDTMAALKVLELKARFPQIALHLYLPCRDQDKFWNSDEKELYRKILVRADAIHYTQEHYSDGCMLQRNRDMVDGSDVCVAFFEKYGGGTGYTYQYALRAGLRVINLADRIKERTNFDER